MLSDDLGALLAEHHRKLHEEVSLWMDSKDTMLEHIARNLVEGAAPLGRKPALDQGAAATGPAACRASKDHVPRRRSSSNQGSTVIERAFSRASTDDGHRRASSRASTDDGRRKSLSDYSDHMKRIRREASSMSLSINSESPPPERPSARGRVRAWLQHIACSYFFCAVILVYIATMGFEVEDVGQDALVHVQTACSAIFALELLVRLYAEGASFFCGDDTSYNLLDLALVAFSLVEMAIQAASSDASDGSLDSVLVLRVLRVVRVIRILRVVRLLRFFRPLRLLVRSICTTLKSLVYILVLLGIIMYSFGVVFAQAARDSHSEPMARHWGSLYTSVLTLFKSVTSGVSWEIVFQPLHEAHWFYGALFVVYVAFTQLAVLNIMTGQFCQSAIESSQHDDEELISEHMADKRFCVSSLQSIFANISDDKDVLTLGDFEQRMSDDRLLAFLQSLGVKVTDAWTLFALLDEDEEHCIGLERFVEGCLRLRGSATAIGLSSLAHEVRWQTRQLNRQVREIRHGLLAAAPVLEL